jgi:hypothetical protein
VYSLGNINSYIDLAIKRLNRVAPITEWTREDEVILNFSDVLSSWAMVMAVQARIAEQNATLKRGETPSRSQLMLGELLTAEGNFFRISADMLSAGKKAVL